MELWTDNGVESWACPGGQIEAWGERISLGCSLFGRLVESGRAVVPQWDSDIFTLNVSILMIQLLVLRTGTQKKRTETGASQFLGVLL